MKLTAAFIYYLFYSGSFETKPSKTKVKETKTLNVKVVELKKQRFNLFVSLL